MIGNTIQIITILVTMGMVVPQIKGLFNVGSAFKPFEDPHINDKLTMYKILYAGIHIVILAGAAYKFSCIF